MRNLVFYVSIEMNHPTSAIVTKVVLIALETGIVEFTITMTKLEINHFDMFFFVFFKFVQQWLSGKFSSTTRVKAVFKVMQKWTYLEKKIEWVYL